MTKNNLLFSIVCIFSLFACNSKTVSKETITTPTKENVEPRIVGNDSDEHGCKPSAGFQWSVIRNECIQIFNAGIRLDPKEANLNKTLSAFVVFKSDNDDAQAEIFLPGEKNAIILNKEKKESAGIWKNEKYVLSQWKGMYSLNDSKKTLLYEGMVK